MERQKQNYNHNIILACTAQKQEFQVNINVPFLVGKIIFHSPRSDAVEQDGYFWLIRQNMTDSYCGLIGGNKNVNQTEPITLVLRNPATFQGQYKFNVLSSDELTGSAPVTHLGNIWLLIEFIEA
ncbi:MAG: hypothetical protein ACP5N7_05325 [Candidatus Pacearchaeota archaeon]